MAEKGLDVKFKLLAISEKTPKKSHSKAEFGTALTLQQAERPWQLVTWGRPDSNPVGMR